MEKTTAGPVGAGTTSKATWKQDGKIGVGCARDGRPRTGTSQRSVMDAGLDPRLAPACRPGPRATGKAMMGRLLREPSSAHA